MLGDQPKLINGQDGAQPQETFAHVSGSWSPETVDRSGNIVSPTQWSKNSQQGLREGVIPTSLTPSSISTDSLFQTADRTEEHEKGHRLALQTWCPASWGSGRWHT